MLPGFLPLLVFIVADELAGTKTALYFAVGFGIVSFVFLMIKDKKADFFILIDTLLLVAMGGISLMLNNDLFFKIKPAAIELILALIIAISLFSPQNLIMKMSERYVKGVTFNNEQIRMFNQMMKVFLLLVVLHIILILISAFFMSKAAWVFISGPLFYIMFALYFAYIFLKNKYSQRKYRNEEWLPLVDKDGVITGKMPRSLCHKGKGKLHPVVHLHVFNAKNELFLQKRPEDKKVQPGKWDTAVGGHISFGDSLEEGLKREAYEELGITDFKAQLLEKSIWETEIESELVYMFMTIYRGKIIINKDELADGKYWSMTEIEHNIGKDVFTPNFEKEFIRLKEFLSPHP